MNGIIIFFISYIVLVVVFSNILKEQQNQISSLLDINIDLFKKLGDYHEIINKEIDRTFGIAKVKEIKIQKILEKAKDTKENYIETLNKIEKVLSEE